MAEQENNIEVINPHDKLFRKTYGEKENARSFLTGYLPGQVLKLLDLSTLEISKDSFIEKELADYYSDMLYQVMLKDGSAGDLFPVADVDGKRNRVAISGDGDPVPGIGAG